MRRADQMTVANLLSYLHTRGLFDLYALRTGGQITEADESWLEAHPQRPTVYARTRKVPRQSAVGFDQRSTGTSAMFNSPRLARALRRAVEDGKYDVIYTYYFRSADDVRRAIRLASKSHTCTPPTFLAMQLSQTLNTRRIRANSPNLGEHSAHLRGRSRLVARYESRIWRHLSRTVLDWQIRCRCY